MFIGANISWLPMGLSGCSDRFLISRSWESLSLFNAWVFSNSFRFLGWDREFNERWINMLFACLALLWNNSKLGRGSSVSMPFFNSLFQNVNEKKPSYKFLERDSPLGHYLTKLRKYLFFLIKKEEGMINPHFRNMMNNSFVIDNKITILRLFKLVIFPRA